MNQQAMGVHSLWSKHIHQEIGGFDTRYLRGTDQDFWVRVSLRGRLVRTSAIVSSIPVDDKRCLPNGAPFAFLRRKYRPLVGSSLAQHQC